MTTDAMSAILSAALEHIGAEKKTGKKAKGKHGGARPGSGGPRLDPMLLEARGAYVRNPGRRRVATGKLAEHVPVTLDIEKPVHKDFVAIGEQYARDVIDGKIPACQLTILACKRHFNDKIRSASTDFPYQFNAERAHKFCSNLERYPHIKGKWAQKGEKIKLEPWQCFATIVPFGWEHKQTTRRRFSEIYFQVPRKNAKSTWAAGVGLNMMLDDDEHGAEIYAGATTEKQAWEVFGPARQMIRNSQVLINKYSIDVMAKSLVKTTDMSKFWPLIGKPGDGSSPSCAIVDEYHEHDTTDLVDTMITGMGARDQPVLLIITTAGTNLASPCYDKYKEADKVLHGVIENDKLFALIYSIDLPTEDKPGDDWADPKSLYKANPNLGVSVDEEYLLAQQRNAVINPAYQNRFKTKHLDVWCNASVAGINMHSWQLACDKGLSIQEFEGQESIYVLDLASKTDICAFVQLFQKMINGQRHYYAFGRYYLPQDTIEESKSNQQAYRKWVIQGHLISTVGAEIDFDQINDDVIESKSHHQVLEVAYDPWRATQLSHQLAKRGATVVEIAQTARNMGVAFDEFLAAIKGGRFHHDGNPVLEWMASNVVAKTVVKGLVVPAKEKIEAKIDGIVAIVMGISRALAHEPQYGFDEFFASPVIVG